MGGAYADERRAMAAGPADHDGPCLGWSIPRGTRVISVREEHRDRGVEGVKARRSRGVGDRAFERSAC